MKYLFNLYILLLLSAYPFCHSASCNTAKPWTWWWFFGNSSTNKDITTQLEYMQKSGIGGICLIPLYGEKGDEKNYVELLSPDFMNKLEYISKECRRLNMGLDMTMGSGWPMGGPWIDKLHSSKKMSSSMKPEPTNFKVKRSSPGGHGYALDPFSASAAKIHTDRFAKVFGKYVKSPIIRAFFNDSYEYSEANYTDNFFDEFKKRRGYDFRPYAPMVYAPESDKARQIAELKNIDSETLSRVWQDYHNTLSDLLYDGMASEFARAAKGMACQSVYQAHGSPGNLIDLYALADIPQTEAFGACKFPIKGVRQDPDYDELRFGRPDSLMVKFASSAANLSGKNLVSAEACTWLSDHFKTALSQVKPELDMLFSAGVNHIFYHGTPYSPISKPFPGRLFYAACNFNYNSHFKEFFPELNKYVERVQGVLQDSKSDNDILVYFPIHAFWRESGGKNKILRFDVHRSREWLKRAPEFESLVRNMDKLGFCFDLISDAALKKLTVRNGMICTKSSSYKILVVPDSGGRLPIETFKEIDRLIKAGAKVVFQNRMPDDAVGLYDLPSKRGEIYDITSSWIPYPDNVRVGQWVPPLLSDFGAKRETLGDSGLSFIRKKQPDTSVYFIANLSDSFTSGELEITAPCIQLQYFDPLTGEKASIPFQRGADNSTKFKLALEPGRSCILFAKSKDFDPALPPKAFFAADSETGLGGEWNIEFLRILPEGSDKGLPPPLKTKELKSWTELGGEAHKSFCGAAKYSLKFELEDVDLKSAYELEFDDIRDACRVKLNGAPLGSIWCAPFKLNIAPGLLKQGENFIEIEISNNSFNRIRHMSAKHENWKAGNFIVDINYKSPSPESKPLEAAGLIGKVKLRRLISPQDK